MTTLSPLKAIEEISYQKIKNTPFRVWHYYAALFVLLIVPWLLNSLFNGESITWIVMIIAAGAWLVSRNIGTNLSRNKGVDSVLIYRFFAAAPWIVYFLALAISMIIRPAATDTLDGLLAIGSLYLSGIVSLVHILGIIVHFHKNKKMVKNIKKDDLFQ